MRWRGELPGPARPLGSGAGVAVLVRPDGELLALDPSDGRPRWRKRVGEAAALAVVRGDELLLPRGQELVRLDLTTGEPSGETLGLGAPLLHTPLPTTTGLLLATYDGRLRAVGSEASWEVDLGGVKAIDKVVASVDGATGHDAKKGAKQFTIKGSYSAAALQKAMRDAGFNSCPCPWRYAGCAPWRRAVRSGRPAGEVCRDRRKPSGV